MSELTELENEPMTEYPRQREMWIRASRLREREALVVELEAELAKCQTHCEHHEAQWHVTQRELTRTQAERDEARSWSRLWKLVARDYWRFEDAVQHKRIERKLIAYLRTTKGE